MQLKHQKNLLPPQDGAAKITALAWAPNNQKFAVCTSDRVIILFDESGEKRDKFSTKPADPKYGKKSYVVKAIAFSVDSTKIAVAQTDNVIFVYRIGEDWREKKVICNKFIQQSAVTCLVWPTEGSIIFGLADGKVRMANVKTNKSSTVFANESYTVSLATNVSGKGFISGHANGSVVRYFFDGDLSGETQGRIINHSCPPYAMAWTSNGIVIGGCDKRIVAYNKDGRAVQQFDYSRDETEKEFASSACSPSGQSVVFGSFDRLRIFNWSSRKGAWEEVKPKEIPNLYTISCLAWKKDGSKVIAGTLCGGVELFDCCLKKTIYKNKFEITHVGLSQVIVENLSTQHKVVVKSNYGYEIDDVRVMGEERYLVARTQETLLLADLHQNKLSEVPWHNTGGNEKFYFDNESVCMIFNAGELTLVEYGTDDVLGSVRTEFMNPHLISVRINERRQNLNEDNKKMAYLVDLKTISIFDLCLNVTLAQIMHDSKIDWLELNETGRKLLFRDKRLRLNLVDVGSQNKMTILNYCTFVQWVPDSDVVVAQNRGNLCIWYNIDMPDKVTMCPVKGEAMGLDRADGKTEVLVKDGVTTYSYTLDESLIEFRTAVDDGNYTRAVTFLETLEMVSETEAMWNTLAKLAMENQKLHIALRCFSALNDIAKVRYLQNVIELAEDLTRTKSVDGFEHYLVRAKLAILSKQFKVAEAIYLEHDDLDEAMSMYKKLHRWDDAIYLAKMKGHPDLSNLNINYLKWLLDTHQEEKAGELKEREGDFTAAVNLYITAGMPTKAAVLISANPEMSSDANLISSVASSLIKTELHEKAGELYEKVNNKAKAMECYTKGKAFQKAVELARLAFPREVVPLEEEWGDHLASQKQLDAAINHYIEAGSTVKALDAAINCHQWKKAVSIIKVIDDPSIMQKYSERLAKHFESIQNFDMAENFYISGGMQKAAIEMYNNARKWEKAYKLAHSFLSPEESVELFSKLAQQLEEQNHLEDAEKLYTLLGEPDTAISMYKKHQQYDHMIKLVKIHHSDLLAETYNHLAKELEISGHHREAEKYYLEAKDWKSAVNMYRAADMWQEAYRVAKSHGGSSAPKQVLYLWAKNLGGEAAVKLLTKHGLLEFATDNAIENAAFDFAFTLARVASKDRLPDIHLQYAMHLEDEGKFKEAEVHFVKAGKPKEAVLMYVHNRDWDDAQRVADAHDPESINDILIGQAEAAFDKKEYAKAESLLLRAQKADIAVKFYKANDMWTDAIRVCREYLPHKLQQLQEECDREGGAVGGSENIDFVLKQAREWEGTGSFVQAVDYYLRVNNSHTNDVSVLEKSWLKAAELALKFLGDVKSVEIAKVVGGRLVEIKKFNSAAQVYLSVGLNKDAIDGLISGSEWNKARKIAKELEPRLESYVEDKYKDFLRNEGKIDQLVNVDALAALDLYAQKGEWRKCVEMAEKQNTKVLHKYLALYSADLINNNRTLDALKLYAKHGAPAFPQNFNIYVRIATDIFQMPDMDNPQGYKILAELRDMLFDLSKNLEKFNEIGATRKEEILTLLLIAHYYATRSACLTEKSLDKIATKLSISLLRHSDVIPADKAYFEAGIAAKNVGWENMAFVILNRYLDLCEAIEEGSLNTLDNTDFQDTDIPFDVPLPEKLYVDEQRHEEIKEWVLAVSMDQKIEQILPIDERMTFEASLVAVETNERSPPCVISGYPVFKNKIEFKNPNKVANKEDWNKFLMATKMSKSEECEDVLRFINDWCGISPSLAYSFQ